MFKDEYSLHRILKIIQGNSWKVSTTHRAVNKKALTKADVAAASATNRMKLSNWGGVD